MFKASKRSGESLVILFNVSSYDETLHLYEKLRPRKSQAESNGRHDFLLEKVRYMNVEIQKFCDIGTAMAVPAVTSGTAPVKRRELVTCFFNGTF